MITLAICALSTLLPAADHDWFVKELTEREQRLREEFRRGGWLLREEAADDKNKVERVVERKNAGSHFLWKEEYVRNGEHRDVIVAANKRYAMDLGRHKAAPAPFQLIRLRSADTPKLFESHDIASTTHVVSGVSAMLENSGKVTKGDSRTFEITDVARSRENGIDRIVARFRSEARRGQKLTRFRKETTFREDLGWAVEKDRSYEVNDGKERLRDAVDVTYDLSRGQTADLALTRTELRSWPKAAGSAEQKSVLTVVRRDPEVSFPEAETTMSFYGLPEPDLPEADSSNWLRRWGAWAAAGAAVLILVWLFFRRRGLAPATA